MMEKREILLCETCGKPFEKKTSNQRFCCLECRMIAYNKQVQEERESENVMPSKMKLKDIIEILKLYGITLEQYEADKRKWIKKYMQRKKYFAG